MSEPLGGRYVLGPPLGSGGSATVFHARDTVLGRDVAVKVLHAHLARDPDEVEDFLDQARATATLDHPNVVAVTDAGHDDGLVWCVQDLVDGLTLAELVAVEGPLAVADALVVLSGVLAGLAHAHVRGVLHLDLSAGNVMVPWVEGRPDLTRAAVLDLGGRHRRDRGGGERVRVSPAYASPEAATGAAAGPAADLYSVGALLFVLVTGGPPFERATPTEVLTAHVHDALPMPRDLPQPVTELLERFLAKAPVDRFATATAAGVAVVRARGALLTAGCSAGRTHDLPPVRSGPVTAPRPQVPTQTGRGPSTGRPDVRREGGGPTAPGHALGGPGQVGTARRPRTAAAAVLLASVLGLGAAAMAWANPWASVADASTARAPASGVSAPASASASPSPVSAAARHVTVPDVVGLSAEAARDALGEAGLTLDVAATQDGPGQAGSVLSSEPAAGHAVTPGSAVVVAVASGSTVIPEVRGLTATQAVATASAAGLQVESALDGAATVTRQDLEPGGRVVVGALLRISGAAATPVPTPGPHPPGSEVPGADTPSPTPSPSPTPTAPDPTPGPSPAGHPPNG